MGPTFVLLGFSTALTVSVRIASGEEVDVSTVRGTGLDDVSEVIQVAVFWPNAAGAIADVLCTEEVVVEFDLSGWHVGSAL